MSKGKLKVRRANTKVDVALGREGHLVNQIYVTEAAGMGTIVDGTKVELYLSDDLMFLIVNVPHPDKETENWIPISNIASITLDEKEN